MSQQVAPSELHGSVRLRLASLGILSGLLVGILMGIAARIAMRLVALVVGQGVEFTYSLQKIAQLITQFLISPFKPRYRLPNISRVQPLRARPTQH